MCVEVRKVGGKMSSRVGWDENGWKGESEGG